MPSVKKTYLGSSIACTCGESARFVSWREATIVSLVGDFRLQRPYYHCGDCHTGYRPLDKTLKLDNKTTPAANEVIALAGLTEAFEPSAATLLCKMTGLRISASKVRTTTEDAGRRLIEVRESDALGSTDELWDWHRDLRGKTCAYVALDHVSVRQQLPGGGKKDSRMAAVAMIYNPGERKQPIEQKRYLAGNYDLTELGRQLRFQSQQVGFHRCQQWIALTDGGNGLEQLIERDFPLAQCILDICHALEHAAELARALHPGDDDKFQELFDGWKEKLKTEGGAALLEEWEAIDLTDRSDTVKKVHEDQCRYVRNNQHRMELGLGRLKQPAKRSLVRDSKGLECAGANQEPTKSPTSERYFSAKETSGIGSGKNIPTNSTYKSKSHPSWSIALCASVADQSIDAFSPASSQSLTRFDQHVAGGVISVMLKDVHQFTEPLLSFLAFFSKHAAFGFLSILLQMIKVQADVFSQSMKFDLIGNPRCAVDVGDRFRCVRKVHRSAHATQHVTSGLTVLAGYTDITMIFSLVVDVTDFEFFVSVVGSWLRTR